ncbi:MAG TPA: hypothetical protein VLA71_21865 [Algoriphagus sp.]|nr:hypothetical protein [Algoriphagus sp.]
MEIKFTEQELQFLAKTYSNSEISLVITGLDRFTIYHPKAEVACEILGFTKRSIVVGYNLGFWKNLLVSWFVKFEMAGIIWDKKHKKVEIDPFSFLPEKEKVATADFSIQEISLEPGSVLIDVGIYPE